jgi:hypothetical protein
MKYFSDFGISYQKREFEHDQRAGLKATKGVVKAGLSRLKSTGTTSPTPGPF